MKWIILLTVIVFLFVFSKNLLGRAEWPEWPEPDRVEQTVHVDVDVEVDVERPAVNGNCAAVSTTEATTVATTTEPTTEATTETTEATTEAPTEETTVATTEVTTEVTTTADVLTEHEHYWSFRNYVEKEDVIMFRCDIGGCAVLKKERVYNLDVLCLNAESGVQIVVHGGLYPAAELYVQYDDFSVEEVVLPDGEQWLDGFVCDVDIDLSRAMWIMVRAFDATARREVDLDFAVIDGVIQR